MEFVNPKIILLSDMGRPPTPLQTSRAQKILNNPVVYNETYSEVRTPTPLTSFLIQKRSW
jgi:hypothetical protein